MTGAAAQEVRPFPWRQLMALFLGERGLAPGAFWALTLPEIQAVIGPAARQAPQRAALVRLMEAFPDGG